MKVFKTIILVLVSVILIATIGLVIFLKSFDIMKFKPQIIEQANKALNREVDFQKAELGFSFFKGVNLKLTNLVVSEDPLFAKGYFLTLKDMTVGVDVLAYILTRKVSIPSISIDSVHVTIIRNKEGIVNAATIAKPQGADPNINISQDSTPAALPAIFISSLKVSDGTVTYIDRSFSPEMSIEITDINAMINRFSLKESFPFVIEAAIMSPKKNIRVNGNAKYDMATSQVSLSSVSVVSDLAQLSIDEIRSSLPMTKGAVLPQKIRGQLEIKIDNLTAGVNGLIDLSLLASLKEGMLSFKELRSDIKDISASVKADEKDLVVEAVKATVGGGSIDARGSITEYMKKQDFEFDVQVKDLDLAELIPQTSSDVQAEGIFQGKFKVNGSGFTPDSLKSALSGDGEISLTKAKLKNINVLRTALDKIDIIPGLSGQVQANLPQNYKQKLTQKDTALSDIKQQVAVSKGRFFMDKIAVGADEFLFSGKGQAGLDSSYSLEGLFLIPADLSAAMVATVDQLKYLQDENNQISFPIKVSGKAQAAQFSVDSEYLTKKLLSKQLFKALDKALGVEEDNSKGQTDKKDTGQQQPSKEKAVKDLLKGIFQ